MRTVAMGAAVAACIVSTATSPIEFVEYEKNTGQRAPKVLHKVNILGGANLPLKTLVTPEGVSTPVSAEELDFLTKNDEFLRAKALGFMSIVRSDRDTLAAVSGMTAKDGSAPKTPGDFEKPPTVGHAKAA